MRDVSQISESKGKKSKRRHKKWHRNIEVLLNTIEKYAFLDIKGEMKPMESIPKDEQLSPQKNKLERNTYIKGYFRRIGVDHKKGVIEDITESMKNKQKNEQAEFPSVNTSCNIFEKHVSFIKSSEISPIEVVLSSPAQKRKGKNLSCMGEDLLQSRKAPKTHFLPQIKSPVSVIKVNPVKLTLKKRKKFPGQQEMKQLFNSCNVVQEDIGQIDKKLKSNEHKVARRLSDMNLKLQQIMKVNFLPEEFIIDNDF
jgi:hypothetical protein